MFFSIVMNPSAQLIQAAAVIARPENLCIERKRLLVFKNPQSGFNATAPTAAIERFPTITNIPNLPCEEVKCFFPWIFLFEYITYQANIASTVAVNISNPCFFVFSYPPIFFISTAFPAKATKLEIMLIGCQLYQIQVYPIDTYEAYTPEITAKAANRIPTLNARDRFFTVSAKGFSSLVPIVAAERGLMRCEESDVTGKTDVSAHPKSTLARPDAVMGSSHRGCSQKIRHDPECVLKVKK